MSELIVALARCREHEAAADRGIAVSVSDRVQRKYIVES